MAILPPPSQPSSARRASSRASSSSSASTSERTFSPRVREKRGAMPPGGNGFALDRAPTNDPDAVRRGKQVDRQVTVPLTSQLTSVKAHAPSSSPPSPPPKRTRVTAVAPTAPSLSRPSKRVQSPPGTTMPTPPLAFPLEKCLDAFRPSRLLVAEYAKYGNPTYAQSRGCHKRFVTYDARAPFVPAPLPSWASGDVRALGSALTTSDRLVADIWARNVVGTGPEGKRTGGVRPISVRGINMFLVGCEFPTRSVALVGILVCVEDKTDNIIYHLDDSTAVVHCVCPVDDEPASVRPKDRPVVPDPTNLSREIFDPTPAFPTGVRPHADTFEVGALVRIVGRISDGAYAGADYRLSVDSMVELRDPNLEAQHHLIVAQLHKDVYSQPFDLDAELAQIRQEEREVEKAWDGQSQAGSEAGSPRKKRFVLPNPLSLSPADLNLPNFVVYIKDHLLRHYTTSPLSPPSGFDFAPTSATDLAQPLPFTLAALESSRTLVKFARRLAAQLARDRARNKAAAKKRLPVLQPKTWATNGDCVRSGVPGMGGRGGSARILAAPIATKRGPPSLLPDIAPAGVDLAIGAQKQFCEALRRMRRMGEIVVLDPSEVELPYEELEREPFVIDESPGPTMAESRERSGGARAGSDGPAKNVEWMDAGPGLEFAYAVDDNDSAPGQLSPPQSPPQSSSTASDQTTPRASRRYARASAPSPSTTPRASHMRPFPLTTTPRPSIPPPLPPRSPGAESWTSSVYGLKSAEDSYQLVTPALLARVLGRLLVGEPRDESAIRTLLAREDKWGVVARDSVVVSEALALLVEVGDVSETEGVYKALVRRYGR